MFYLEVQNKISFKMKKLIFFLGVFLIVGGCDKIKNPSQRPPQVYNCIDTLHRVIKTNTATNPATRKVLVEDYTGHYCPNCPRAAEAAEAILKSNPINVVVIANHVTKDYAKTNPDTTALTFREDFRNDVSTEWDSPDYLAISKSGGLPNGAINRIGPSFPKAYTQWSSLVNTELGLPQIARLDVTSYYDTLAHFLSVKVKTTFLSDLSNNVNLVLVLTQDSITGYQKDNNAVVAADDRDPDDPQSRMHYRFDHIVIDGINSASGQLVKAAPINKNDTVTVAATCYTLNKCFGRSIVGNPYKVICVNDKYVNLVAFVYNTTTLEVLQVEKLRIK